MESLPRDSAVRAVLPYAFCRDRLLPLNEFATIRILLRKVLLDSKFRGDSAVFAAPVYSRVRGGHSLFEVSVLEHDGRFEDPLFVENKKQAEKGELLLSKDDSLLAFATHFVINAEGLDSSHVTQLRDGIVPYDWSATDGSPRHYYGIPNPGSYRMFRPVSEREARYHTIMPLYIDKRLVAVVGFDSNDLDPDMRAHIGETLPAIQDVVQKIYGKYYEAWEKHREGIPAGHYDTHGTLVRRGYYEAIMKEDVLKRWVTPASRCLIVYYDGNGVKKINDTEGHGAGDDVIGRYAGAICEAVESLLDDRLTKNAVVVKWGGDEFIVVLTLSESDETALVAELDRRTGDTLTKSAEYRYSGPDLRKLGLAGGWSVWEGQGPAEVVEKNAEKGMYLCKGFMHLSQERILQGNSVLPERSLVATLSPKEVEVLWNMLLEKVGIVTPETAVPHGTKSPPPISLPALLEPEEGANLAP